MCQTHVSAEWAAQSLFWIGNIHLGLLQTCSLWSFFPSCGPAADSNRSNTCWFNTVKLDEANRRQNIYKLLLVQNEQKFYAVAISMDFELHELVFFLLDGQKIIICLSNTTTLQISQIRISSSECASAWGRLHGNWDHDDWPVNCNSEKADLPEQHTAGSSSVGKA